MKALGKHCGMDAKAADAFLEGLKEEERYVLEVCGTHFPSRFRH